LYDGILPKEMMRLATVNSALSRGLYDGTPPNTLRFDGFLRFCRTVGLRRLHTNTHTVSDITHSHVNNKGTVTWNIFCLIKIQAGFTFLVLVYPGCPGKEAINWV